MRTTTTANVGETVGIDAVGATARRRAPAAAMRDGERLRTLRLRRALCARTADALAADRDRADSLATRAAHALLDDIDAELRELAHPSGEASAA